MDIVEFLTSYSRTLIHDLEELYRRIAFNIAISNHDDYLRNHGFLLGRDGWILSLAYDLNPSLGNLQYLSLNITLDSGLSSFDLLHGTAAFYQISEDRGRKIIQSVSEIVRGNWGRLARRSAISEFEIKRMRPCFEK